MTINIPSYTQILSEFFPEVRFSCSGSGNDYNNIYGNTLPTQAALDALKLSSVQATLKAQVNVYRLEWMTDYFTYDSKQWDCDDSGLTNIIGVLLLGVVSGNVLPEGTVFRDHNNTNHEVTFMYMALMASALMSFKQAVYSHSWNMKASIDALTTIEDVQAYDITAGWPAK